MRKIRKGSGNDQRCDAIWIFASPAIDILGPGLKLRETRHPRSRLPFCSFRVAVVQGRSGTRSQAEPIEVERRDDQPEGLPTRYTCVHSFSRVWRNKGRSGSPRSRSFVRSFSSPQRGRPVANQRRVATVHRPTADYRFSAASRYRTAAGEEVQRERMDHTLPRLPLLTRDVSRNPRRVRGRSHAQGRFFSERSFPITREDSRRLRGKNGSPTMDLV